MSRNNRNLNKATAELIRTLVEANVLTKEQGKELEALLLKGKQDEAGELLGRFLDGKDRPKDW